VVAAVLSVRVLVLVVQVVVETVRQKVMVQMEAPILAAAVVAAAG
jgi:hypothetical protein